jgi:hypothetical protein
VSARGDSKPHAAAGFVLGALGERFNSCCSLRKAIAWVVAACIVDFWEMPPNHALAL